MSKRVITVSLVSSEPETALKHTFTWYGTDIPAATIAATIHTRFGTSPSTHVLTNEVGETLVISPHIPNNAHLELWKTCVSTSSAYSDDNREPSVGCLRNDGSLIATMKRTKPLTKEIVEFNRKKKSRVESDETRGTLESSENLFPKELLRFYGFPLSSNRLGHVLIPIDKNTMFIYGGIEEGKFVQNPSLYDLETCSSTEIGPRPIIAFHSGIFHKESNSVYMFGGDFSTPIGPKTPNIGVLHCFSFETEMLTVVDTTNRCPKKRSCHSTALINDTLYIFGGINTKGKMITAFLSLDLKTRAWDRIETNPKLSPHSRMLHTTTVVGSDIVLFGGNNHKSCYSDVFVFSPAEKTWTKQILTGGVEPRTAHSAVLIPGTKWILIMGGKSSIKGHISLKNPVIVLDTDTWEVRSIACGLKGVIYGHSCAVVSVEQVEGEGRVVKLLLYGGECEFGGEEYKAKGLIITVNV